MPIQVSEAIDSDTAEKISVERYSGSFVDGNYVKSGKPIRFNTLASVQQPTPKEIQNLPEGERDKDIKKFISLKPVRTSSDRDSTLPDIVIYKSVKYKIIMSGNWDSYGHTTAFGTREKDQ